LRRAEPERGEGRELTLALGKRDPRAAEAMPNALRPAKATKNETMRVSVRSMVS
jgi:hypothetical protein